MVFHTAGFGRHRRQWVNYLNSSGGGGHEFEVLVTDKSTHNNLIPVNPPTCGFTARELHGITGQGSLHVHLQETSPSQVKLQYEADQIYF